MARTFIVLIVSAVLLMVSFSDAQTPGAGQEQALLALIKEIQTQQAQMAENQKEIETKLADVSETVRVARIYAGRSQ